MQNYYYVTNQFDSIKVEDIQKMLTKSDADKINAMQKLIALEMNDDSHPELVMSVIQYVMPSNDHTLKRLFLLYLSSIKRTDNDGKLLSELILAINTLINDINHPNEYIRALTLKFICSVNEKEIIQPITHEIINSIENTKSLIVKKQIYCAIRHIYCLYPDLITNATDILVNALKKEKSVNIKCTVLRTLCFVNLEMTIKYILSKASQIMTFNEKYQMEILHIIKGVSKSTPQFRDKFADICYSLIECDSQMVMYEAACCLSVVSSSPKAIRTSVSVIMNIINLSSDINVKLSGIERIDWCIDNYPRIMSTMEMELLRGFQNTSVIVREQIIAIVMRCVNKRNVTDVVSSLKKELMKEGDDYYKSLVITSIKQCSNQFDCKEVVDILIENLYSSPSIEICHQTINFIKNVVREDNNSEIHEMLRKVVENNTNDSITEQIIYLLTHYSKDKDDMYKTFSIVYEKINEGKFSTNLNIITNLVQLCLKIEKTEESKLVNEIKAKTLKVLIKRMKDNESERVRIRQYITVITKDNKEIKEAFLKEVERDDKVIKDEVLVQNKLINVDEDIYIEGFGEEKNNTIEADNKDNILIGYKNIIQLSGYCDPLYIEASLILSQFDINVDCLIVNQTEHTLQNITVQLVPMSSGLLINSQSVPLTLGANAFNRITIPIKITGTSSGLIAGYVNYDCVGREVTTGSSDNHMVLNNISIESLDSIIPTKISNEEFQKKWSEYEWENKINVDTKINELVVFLKFITKEVKMECITPEKLFCNEIGFLSANLYATTIFGDDALANISIEERDNKIIGTIRIRAKTQGVAVSLGDKIMAAQHKGSED